MSNHDEDKPMTTAELNAYLAESVREAEAERERAEPEDCDSCNGTGECWDCNGTGRSEDNHDEDGECLACYGMGICSACDGDGLSLVVEGQVSG